MPPEEDLGDPLDLNEIKALLKRWAKDHGAHTLDNLNLPEGPRLVFENFITTEMFVARQCLSTSDEYDKCETEYKKREQSDKMLQAEKRTRKAEMNCLSEAITNLNKPGDKVRTRFYELAKETIEEYNEAVER